MAALFHEPIFATIVASGDKLFFYQTGTTTDLTVYTDGALTTPHAQPVVADSDGEFPAIYIDTSGITPKVILKDTTEATEKWAVDPFPINDLSTVSTDLTTAEAAIDSLEGRMDTAESEIDALESGQSSNDDELADHETRITNLEGASSSTFSETVLYNNLSAPTSGPFTLSEDWQTFDALCMVTTTNSNSSTRTPSIFTKGFLDTGGTFAAGTERGSTSNPLIFFEMTNATTITVSNSVESSRIVRVIGIKF